MHGRSIPCDLPGSAGAIHIAPGRLHHLRLHSTHRSLQLVAQMLAGIFEIAARWLGMDCALPNAQQ